MSKDFIDNKTGGFINCGRVYSSNDSASFVLVFKTCNFNLDLVT